MNDTILALCCLIGKEDVDWLSHDKDMKNWELYLLIHSN